MWLLVAESTEPTDVERYLKEFPDGTYTTVAQLKLEQLSRPPKPVAPQIDRTTTPPPPPAPKRNVAPDLENFLQMVESPDYRRKYKGAAYIYKRKFGKNPEALKVLGTVLTEESQKEGLTKKNVKVLIYISKVIALSSNGDYVKVLDNVVNTTPNPTLRKYAVKYTNYLEKTTGQAR